MKKSVVKALWSEGKPACCTLIKFGDPRVAEIAAMSGFDCLWMDLEHHCWSVETAENMIRAARLLGCDAPLLKRALEQIRDQYQELGFTMPRLNADTKASNEYAGGVR
jgi:2-keto-3-deoxy-L-rhamnonate aldolase RhmA